MSEKMYSVNLSRVEIEHLSTMVRRSIGKTRDTEKRIMLCLLHDELDATLFSEQIVAANQKLDELSKKLKRSHLKVVK